MKKKKKKEDVNKKINKQTNFKKLIILKWRKRKKKYKKLNVKNSVFNIFIYNKRNRYKNRLLARNLKKRRKDKDRFLKKNIADNALIRRLKKGLVWSDLRYSNLIRKKKIS